MMSMVQLIQKCMKVIKGAGIFLFRFQKQKLMGPPELQIEATGSEIILYIYNYT